MSRNESEILTCLTADDCWSMKKRRGGCMFIAASAYQPPSTFQSVRLGLHACLFQEILQLPPTKRFGEYIGQLRVRPNPLDDNLVEVQDFVDDVKLPLKMTMIISGCTVGAVGDGGFCCQKRELVD